MAKRPITGAQHSMTTASLSRVAETDPLILMIKERAQLVARLDEIEERADEVRSSLPGNVREEKVSITFAAGFTDRGDFHFSGRVGCKALCSGGSYDPLAGSVNPRLGLHRSAADQ
jgi:hypothetical protein